MVKAVEIAEKAAFVALPDAIVPIPEQVIACPGCGTPIAKGVLGRGTRLAIKCRRPQCKYHQINTPYVILVP
jgi:PHP family Zn ribbon phosphoesterase